MSGSVISKLSPLHIKVSNQGTVATACSTDLLVGEIGGKPHARHLQCVCLTTDQAAPAASGVCADMLDPRVSLAALPLDLSALPGGTLPGPRRDSSCCPAGPSSFMVIGGFDGQAECMDILLVQVRSCCIWAVSCG
jgi:hypothetical protein